MNRITARKAIARPDAGGDGHRKVALVAARRPTPRRTAVVAGSSRGGQDRVGVACPDGSVPMVMRGGSRGGTSAITASVAVVADEGTVDVGASAGGDGPSGSFSQLSSPVGSDGAVRDGGGVAPASVPDGSSTLSPSFHTGDSDVKVDHTSRSSDSPGADRRGLDLRQLAGRRLGPVRQRTGRRRRRSSSPTPPR